MRVAVVSLGYLLFLTGQIGVLTIFGGGEIGDGVVLLTLTYATSMAGPYALLASRNDSIARGLVRAVLANLPFFCLLALARGYDSHEDGGNVDDYAVIASVMVCVAAFVIANRIAGRFVEPMVRSS